MKGSFCSVCIWLKVGEQVLHSIYDSFNLPTYCTLHFLSLVRLNCKVTPSCGQFIRLDISVASLKGYLSKWSVCRLKSLSGQFAGLDLYVPVCKVKSFFGQFERLDLSKAGLKV